MMCQYCVLCDLEKKKIWTLIKQMYHFQVNLTFSSDIQVKFRENMQRAKH